MNSTEQQILKRARADLASRLGISDRQITGESIAPAEFSDAALGAAIEDEMSAQVITPGWRIGLEANGQSYEYRSNGRTLRLFHFKGKNYRI